MKITADFDVFLATLGVARRDWTAVSQPELRSMTPDISECFGQFDEYARAIAERVAKVDRHRLKGGEEQYVAVIQAAILEAMVVAHAHAAASTGTSDE